MTSKAKYALYFFIFLVIALVVLVLSYNIANSSVNSSLKVSAVESNGDDIVISEKKDETKDETNKEEAKQEAKQVELENEIYNVSNIIEDLPIEVKKDTRFIFEDIYSDGTKEIKEIYAPMEFVGLGESDLKENYKDWNMVSFDQSEIYFTREIELPKSMYVLTTLDDEIVVYFKDSDGTVNLEEKTGIELSSLPESDVNKLNQGLVYYNRADILKALQNYDN